MKTVKKNSALRNVFFSLSLSCILLFSCSDDSLNPPTYEPKDPDIEFSGIWLLEGGEEVTSYSAWPIPAEENPVQKEFSQGFTVMIRDLDENRIQIYGLVGADAGRAENAVFPECSDPENCKVFGIKTGDYKWEIDIQNGPRTYHAILALKKFINLNEFTLEGTYDYQNKTIEYKMDGRRIPEL